MIGWRSSARLTALEQHSDMPGGRCPLAPFSVQLVMMRAAGLVWVAFTFSGICGANIDDMEPLDYNGCAAIELLSLSGAPSASCALGICALSVCFAAGCI